MGVEIVKAAALLGAGIAACGGIGAGLGQGLTSAYADVRPCPRPAPIPPHAAIPAPNSAAALTISTPIISPPFNLHLLLMLVQRILMIVL